MHPSTSQSSMCFSGKWKVRRDNRIFCLPFFLLTHLKFPYLPLEKKGKKKIPRRQVASHLSPLLCLPSRKHSKTGTSLEEEIFREKRKIFFLFPRSRPDILRISPPLEEVLSGLDLWPSGSCRRSYNLLYGTNERLDIPFSFFPIQAIRNWCDILIPSSPGFRKGGRLTRWPLLSSSFFPPIRRPSFSPTPKSGNRGWCVETHGARFTFSINYGKFNIGLFEQHVYLIRASINKYSLKFVGFTVDLGDFRTRKSRIRFLSCEIDWEILLLLALVFFHPSTDQLTSISHFSPLESGPNSSFTRQRIRGKKGCRQKRVCFGAYLKKKA